MFSLPEEARISRTHHVLVVLSGREGKNPIENFCGTVISGREALPDLTNKAVYLCGDLSIAASFDFSKARSVHVVRELARGLDNEALASRWPMIDVGRVPVLVHGVGVYYRQYFDPNDRHFERICNEHTFQDLTESTKPSKARRTGIYLTPVRQEGNALHFHLLRCSTNLSGPTENFRATDRHIVDAIQQEATLSFENAAPLNHVLAQIYHNTARDSSHKESKASISAHADKTKDMPPNGLLAFCTFYEQLEKLETLPDDPFDLGYKTTSALTRLRFRLKEDSPPEAALPEQFSVTLYPGSVFFIPLSTNRLYTHEIVPPQIDAERIPTRLGYVVRCSNTEAVHKNDQTYLPIDGTLVPLEEPTHDGMTELRWLYAKENRSHGRINYGNKFRFSMNKGDYRAPLYDPSDEFRVYDVPVDELFEPLSTSAPFEDTVKGRQGAILVAPDALRGIPLVRSTTKYTRPPHPFRALHAQLAQQIRACASLPKHFNNALIELYTNTCTTMGAHSDLALDLEEDSEIALFSCYEHHDFAEPPRKLLVESKKKSGPSFAIPLRHNSIVVFSTDTNRRFRHRIVLDAPAHTPENRWLSVTFRTAKTFVRFREQQPFLAEDTPLALANNTETGAFLQLRSRENQEVAFVYPPINYTISESDRRLPE